MTKEALKMALEALEMFCEHGAILRPIETRDAIKEALANEALEKMAENARELGLDYEPAQEPVAWEQFYPEMGKPKLAYLSPTVSSENACYIPPQRPWVGLTDEDFYGQSELQVMAMKYAEAKLKERNT